MAAGRKRNSAKLELFTRDVSDLRRKVGIYIQSHSRDWKKSKQGLAMRQAASRLEEACKSLEEAKDSE